MILALLIVSIGVLSRFLPHIPNFAPITAIALFSGVYLEKRYALILPLAAMIISDYFLGFHSTTFFVYFSFLISAGIGILIKNKKTPVNILKGSLVASIQFFIITNFGVWAATNMYEKSFAGLMYCYYMGIPFFRGTIMGDLFYTGVFFGGYELSKVIVKKYAHFKAS